MTVDFYTHNIKASGPLKDLRNLKATLEKNLDKTLDKTPLSNIGLFSIDAIRPKFIDENGDIKISHALLIRFNTPGYQNNNNAVVELSTKHPTLTIQDAIECKCGIHFYKSGECYEKCYYTGNENGELEEGELN